MLATSEWETLRSRNGWQNLYLDRRDFTRFLEQQEQEIRSLLIELGFLRQFDP
jgi:putative tricarboxylic transport membrane protein